MLPSGVVDASAAARSLTLLAILLLSPAGAAGEVELHHDTLVVPTHPISGVEARPPLFDASADRAPRGLPPYLELQRGQAGASPVEYEALVLENEYLRLTVLPALGGRLFSAWDKDAGRELFHRPATIKPTSYNPRGAWPVGNLELVGPYDAHMLTWPGEPWAWIAERAEDGGRSIVLSHVDHVFHQKLWLTIKLRPGRSGFEATVRILNRTPLPSRYLLWMNGSAVATNGTRFIYPMSQVLEHQNGAIVSWPMSQGVDLSWYRNNPSMRGVFGLDTWDDFIAVYDHDADRGLVRVADRRAAQGIKTWTWGTGAAGRRALAEYADDGVPYVELQGGRFTWDGVYGRLDPGQMDGWTECWYGVAGLGDVTAASPDAAAALTPGAGPASTLAVAATGRFPGAQIELFDAAGVRWRTRADLAPGTPLRASLPFPAPPDITGIRVLAAGGAVILERRPPARSSAPASAPPAGDRLETARTLERAGQTGAAVDASAPPAGDRLEAARALERAGRPEAALDAYAALVARGRGDVQALTALGRLELDQLRYGPAEQHLERAARLSPDAAAAAEARYLLGIARLERGDLEAADAALARVPEDARWGALKAHGRARVLLARGDAPGAARMLAGASDLFSLPAKAFALRKAGDARAAEAARAALVALDPTSAFAEAERLFARGALGSDPAPFSGQSTAKPGGPRSALRARGGPAGHDGRADARPRHGARAVPDGTLSAPGEPASPSPGPSAGEGRDADEAPRALAFLDRTCGDHPQGFVELAIEYLRLSAWDEADAVLGHAAALAERAGRPVDPAVLALRLHSAVRLGRASAALGWARRTAIDPCPEVLALQRELDGALTWLLRHAPECPPIVEQLLGDVQYAAGRRDDGIARWRHAAARDPRAFGALVRLGAGLSERGDERGALAAFLGAAALNGADVRTAIASARLLASTGAGSRARAHLARALAAHPADDRLIEALAALDAQSGALTSARARLEGHVFEPRHRDSALLRLHQDVELLLAATASPAAALEHLARARHPPANLGADDFDDNRSVRLAVMEASVRARAGDLAAASAAWHAAARLTVEGEEEALFQAIARRHDGAPVMPSGPPAPRGPGGRSRAERGRAHHLAGLAALARGAPGEAAVELRAALQVDPANLGARQVLAWLKSGLLVP